MLNYLFKKKQAERETHNPDLDIELPIDRIICLNSSLKKEEKVVSYRYCCTDFFLLDKPLDIEALTKATPSIEPIQLGLAIQLTGQNKGMVYNAEVHDRRVLCIGMTVSAGNHDRQLLHCTLENCEGRDTITLGELLDLSEEKTNKSISDTRKAALEEYKEWGIREY